MQARKRPLRAASRLAGAALLCILLKAALDFARAADPPVALIVTNGAYDLLSLQLQNVQADGTTIATR